MVMTRLIRRARRNRLVDFVLFALIVLALLAVVALLPEPELRQASGRARVIDGDSLALDGIEVRLKGIDAPELAQTCMRSGRAWPCGREAAERLRGLLRGRTVVCAGARRDGHGRLLAVCRIGESEINRRMVEIGWAVSSDDYAGAERRARAAGRGIWAGPFERPADWRAGKRAD